MKLKKLLTIAEAMNVIGQKASATDEEILQAYLSISLYKKRLDDILSKGEGDIVRLLLGAGNVEVKGSDYVLKARTKKTESISLTKQQKEFILKNPEVFKDYISSTIVGPKVRSAVLSATLTEIDGVPIIPTESFGSDIKIKLKK